MNGSRLHDLFAEVYAENTIPHMSEKAIVRAMRAHTLAESALMTLLLEKLVEDEGLDVERLRYFYDKIGLLLNSMVKCFMNLYLVTHLLTLQMT